MSMFPKYDPWKDDDEFGWLMVAIVGLILAMFLAGCASYPELESEKAARAKPETVTWCETRVIKRECWEVPREDVERAIRDIQR